MPSACGSRDFSPSIARSAIRIFRDGQSPLRRRSIRMNSFDQENLERNKQRDGFGPLPSHQEEIEDSVGDGENAKKAENEEPAEEEADQRKTEVVTKETLLRVTGGLL